MKLDCWILGTRQVYLVYNKKPCTYNGKTEIKAELRCSDVIVRNI